MPGVELSEKSVRGQGSFAKGSISRLLGACDWTCRRNRAVWAVVVGGKVCARTQVRKRQGEKISSDSDLARQIYRIRAQTQSRAARIH